MLVERPRHDAAAPGEGLLLLRGGEVFAPEPLGRRDLLIGAGRILHLAESIPAPSGLSVAVIDASGLLVCPGLIDSLVHVSGGGGEGGFATRFPPLTGAQALAAGVTTVIGALGTDEVTRSHADLLASCRALDEAGISAFALSGSYRVPVQTITGCLRRDLVLIPDLIGVGEVAIADDRGSQPSVQELARIGADTRVAGLLAGKRTTVLVHVGDARDGLELLRSLRDGAPLPVDLWHPTHINRQRVLLQEGLDWQRSGGSIDLTTSTTDELLAAGEVPAAEALAWLRNEAGSLRGVTLSSDAQASLPHFDGQGRLLSLKAAPIGSLLQTIVRATQHFRVPFAETLATATSNPAGIWGLARKGQIGVGADADLILLEPATLALHATIAAGRLRPVQAEGAAVTLAG